MLCSVHLLACPRRAPKVRSACAKVRMCSSTLAHSHIRKVAIWCPRTKSTNVRMCHRAKCFWCSSTFAFGALANVPIACLVLEHFALSHKHFALLGLCGDTLMKNHSLPTRGIELAGNSVMACRSRLEARNYYNVIL